MSRTWNIDTIKKIGEQVELKGWIHARRDMGKIIFADLRDKTGIVQVVFAPSPHPNPLPRGEGVHKKSPLPLGEGQGEGDSYALAKTLRAEYVVEVRGKVQRRTEKTVNPKIPTGTVEILATDLKILAEAKTPPFELDKDTRAVNEEVRLKYRYLDLRSERMHANLILRDKVIKFIRDWLHSQEFIEVETPILTKGTPEGAREYIVPARLHPGKFYVLPQSPQQFKQLLMVAGVERYFQIARCFRDEDQRGDRQPEFTQLDLEMSFVDQEDVLKLTEDLFVALVEHLNQLAISGLIHHPSPGLRPPSPQGRGEGEGPYHITKKPFPRISYDEAMKQYQSDRPDIRKDKNDPHELGFCFVVDFPMFEWSDTDGHLVPSHHLFTAPKDADEHLLDSAPEKAKSKQHDFVLNGFEIAGGSIRIHKPDIQRKIFKILKLDDKEAEDRFGHMLEAFTYGAPPHGGIAPGLDRIVMILAGEPNIREVMAFPKTGDARDPMMDAPSELPAKALKEAHIKVVK